jgi:hypothetical protein
MNLLSHYLSYVEQTEPPYIYHRWTALSMIGALLGRRVYIQFGHQKIHPNLYTMLIGEPGSRKSTAIKIGQAVAKKAGYNHFAASKTSKERFLLDFEGVPEDEYQQSHGSKRRSKSADISDYSAISEQIFGEDQSGGEPKECFVCADEFNEFIGIRNIEFISLLGTLWDWDDNSRPFESRIKTGRSARIYQPTLSILGGNTHENFNTAFPPEILGQGFFSRLLLIYGEKSGRRFTIPPQPTEEATASLVNHFASLQALQGEVVVDTEAASTLDIIYRSWMDIPDSRFLSYSNRRFTHFLKLCISVAASQNSRDQTGRLTISNGVIEESNTYLTAAEILMPKALGEFGRGRYSATINKIIEVLKSKDEPMNTQAVWKEVRRDLNKITELVDILNGMVSGGSIFHITGKGYMIAAQKAREYEFVNWDLLTTEEKGMLA